VGFASTAAALGYGVKDKLLIINADDFGLCHATNTGIQQLLTEGNVSSATIMMPCGWARGAALWAARHPHLDVGVHWTFTSEWSPMKWGPVERRGSTMTLVTDEGYFPTDAKTFERQADASEVKQELIAQLEMALTLGIDVTHADNHMGSLYGLQKGRHFLLETFDVCAQFGIPFRLPRHLLAENGSLAIPDLSEQAWRLAAEAEARGVVVLDYLQGLPFREAEGETYGDYKRKMMKLLRELRPGVTELIIHPSLITEELCAFHTAPLQRGMEMEIFRDEEVQQLLKTEGIIPIHWRDLRDLQRRQRGSTA